MIVNYVKAKKFGFSSTKMSTLESLNVKLGLHSMSESDPCSSSIRATPDIEKRYVHRVYDAIAPHFSSTRFAKWPKVANFLNTLPSGSVVLDAGCGNGKYLGFNVDCFYVGCDISPPLVDICAGRGHEVMVADAVNLPYRSNFGDSAISIAVLHHLSTGRRRRKAIEELVRVVRKGGLVLITVWAVEQEDRSLLTKWTPLSPKYDEGWVSPSSPRVRNSSKISLDSISETDNGAHQFSNLAKEGRSHLEVDQEETTESRSIMDSSVSFGTREGIVSSDDKKVETNQEYFVPWHLPYHRAEINGASASALENGLAKKDDKKGAMVYNRYYHVFVEGELESLVSGMDNATIVEQFYDKSNWCIVLKKI
ncbi:alkylated DNA repair protein alkB-like protein 8 [Iris pallida]|uniref:Alkylated DNA repair protein alkB-like protein 8 n=1 Tax=Iris pallida TaxID=29817 RepID=A0AAX6EAX6_IRIPA|nr:alkylated DNA repair protein alkB-like protein 8 [Iris pallida]